MSKSVSVSLIITTYNWPRALELTLASVLRQTRLPDEVIIADDGSGSETEQIVNKWAALLPCRVHHTWQEDQGYRLARSRNRAIAASTSDYLVLIDGDMILQQHFIEDHVACARLDCFIQGARPRLTPSITAELLAGVRSTVSPLSPGIEHRAYALRSRLLSRYASKARFSLNGIQGCNQSFWRRHVVQINGYDERFSAWGPEDREFAARLLHIGLKRNYIRHRAIAFHLHHLSRAPQDFNPFDRLLHETLLTKAIWCAQGLSSHANEPDSLPRKTSRD